MTETYYQRKHNEGQNVVQSLGCNERWSGVVMLRKRYLRCTSGQEIQQSNEGRRKCTLVEINRRDRLKKEITDVLWLHL